MGRAAIDSPHGALLSCGYIPQGTAAEGNTAGALGTFIGSMMPRGWWGSMGGDCCVHPKSRVCVGSLRDVLLLEQQHRRHWHPQDRVNQSSRARCWWHTWWCGRPHVFHHAFIACCAGLLMRVMKASGCPGPLPPLFACSTPTRVSSLGRLLVCYHVDLLMYAFPTVLCPPFPATCTLVPYSTWTHWASYISRMLPVAAVAHNLFPAGSLWLVGQQQLGNQPGHQPTSLSAASPLPSPVPV